MKYKQPTLPRRNRYNGRWKATAWPDSYNIPGALIEKLQGTVPDQNRGFGHMVPTCSQQATEELLASTNVGPSTRFLPLSYINVYRRVECLSILSKCMVLVTIL